MTNYNIFIEQVKDIARKSSLDPMILTKEKPSGNEIVAKIVGKIE